MWTSIKYIVLISISFFQTIDLGAQEKEQLYYYPDLTKDEFLPFAEGEKNDFKGTVRKVTKTTRDLILESNETFQKEKFNDVKQTTKIVYGFNDSGCLVSSIAFDDRWVDIDSIVLKEYSYDSESRLKTTVSYDDFGGDKDSVWFGYDVLDCSRTFNFITEIRKYHHFVKARPCKMDTTFRFCADGKLKEKTVRWQSPPYLGEENFELLSAGYVFDLYSEVRNDRILIEKSEGLDSLVFFQKINGRDSVNVILRFNEISQILKIEERKKGVLKFERLFTYNSDGFVSKCVTAKFGSRNKFYKEEIFKYE